MMGGAKSLLLYFSRGKELMAEERDLTVEEDQTVFIAL
jgi:hypothetical protein